jgi:dodecin
LVGEPAEACSHAETARRIAWLARIKDEAHGKRSMSVVGVIELSAESAEGYDDAVRQAVRNIRSVWLKEFEAVVGNDRVTQFRVAAKVSFLLDPGTSAG